MTQLPSLPRTPLTRMRRWYITSAHRVDRWTGAGLREVPFDTGHVRVLGGTRTACGLAALNWPIFWDVSADMVERMCPDCLAVGRPDIAPRD